MFDALMHAFGLCPDAHTHLNLLQLLAGGLLTSCSAAGLYIRNALTRKGS